MTEGFIVRSVTLSLALAIGVIGVVLLLLLVVILRAGNSKRARRQWRNAPPSWGGLYRDSMARTITHPKRVRLDQKHGEPGHDDGSPSPSSHDEQPGSKG